MAIVYSGSRMISESNASPISEISCPQSERHTNVEKVGSSKKFNSSCSDAARNDSPILIDSDSSSINEQRKISKGGRDSDWTFAMELRDFLKSSPSQKIAKDFKFLKTVGEGSFSTVYLAQDVSTEKRYAVKVFPKKDVMVKEREKEVLAECKALHIMTFRGGHPFIVSLYSAFADNMWFYIAMTYAEDHDLYYHIRKLGSFEDEVAKFYAAEIVCALEFMHECSIIHRDLKPENILITAKRHIMLSDFGTAKIIGAEVDSMKHIVREKTSTIDHKSDRNNSFVGTAEYFSPEALKDWEIGPACDYWALGAIIFQMISGTPPFRGINHYHIFQRIQKLDYSFPSGFPELSKDLVQRLLVYDPKKRLGSNEMGGCATVKAHNFFSMIEWENLPSMTPPPLKAYVPASAGEPAYHSDFINPEDIEPGFDSATKSRLMGASVKEFLSQAAIEAKQAERQRRLEEQNQNNPYHHIVGERLILKSGLLIKKKGLSYRRRIFLLTEGPHIHYVDEATKEHKGEIPMCKKLRTEGKNFRAFFVHTPYRTYYLFDPAERAMEWCDAIDDLRNRYMDILPETSDPPKSKRYRFL